VLGINHRMKCLGVSARSFGHSRHCDVEPMSGKCHENVVVLLQDMENVEPCRQKVII